MSRSYKKYPIVRQERVEARDANRYIRHNVEIEIPPKGNYYKKIKNFGWNWGYRWSLEDAKKEYYENEFIQRRWTTLEEYLIWYRKNTLFK